MDAITKRIELQKLRYICDLLVKTKSMADNYYRREILSADENGVVKDDVEPLTLESHKHFLAQYNTWRELYCEYMELAINHSLSDIGVRDAREYAILYAKGGEDIVQENIDKGINGEEDLSEGREVEIGKWKRSEGRRVSSKCAHHEDKSKVWYVLSCIIIALPSNYSHEVVTHPTLEVGVQVERELCEGRQTMYWTICGHN